MATPFSLRNSNNALSTGPSRTLLQQLLEEIQGASSTRTGCTGSPPPSPPLSLPSPPPSSPSPLSSYSRSSYQNHSPSVWVGGSVVAQDAREKLRAADEARWRRAAANAIDGAPDLHTPRLCLDTSRLGIHGTNQRYEHGRDAHMGPQRTPDPVRYPHEYMQHVLKGSLLSSEAGLAPGIQGHGTNSLHLQAPSLDTAIPPSLSPLIFSDIYFDDSSSLSPRTEITISPTDAPTSATTIYTAEALRTPTGGVALKQPHLDHDSLTDASAQKRCTMTVPDLRGEEYYEMAVDAPRMFIGVGGDNRSLLRHETFTEQALTPSMSIGAPMNDTLPKMSSFRSTDANAQGQPSIGPLMEVARAFTSPTESTSLAGPYTPAWLRPMHLVDTGGKSIYKNVHDDGPIRHALCLWCFRSQGSFCKVHKHGYESCGRKEVLDSHYWEDDKWPEDSSDESNDSDN